MRGPVVPFGVSDIVARHGPRRPDSATAQRRFRLATIVVSIRRPLTQAELDFLDYFAARGKGRKEVSFASGFSSGKALPFYLATGRRATLETRLPPRG